MLTLLWGIGKAMAAQQAVCVLQQGGLEEAVVQLVASIGVDDMTVAAELSPAGVGSLLQVW